MSSCLLWATRLPLQETTQLACAYGILRGGRRLAWLPPTVWAPSLPIINMLLFALGILLGETTGR